MKFMKIMAKCLILGILIAAGFLGGVITSREIQKKEDRTMILPTQAQQLLEAVTAVREGNADSAIPALDSLLGDTLFKTAYDIPDDCMDQLPEETLITWQLAKEYYEKYDVNPITPIQHVKAKLRSVPWSEVQLAQRKFEANLQTYRQKQAPALNFSHWLGKQVTEDEMKGKVILLDFWNARCKPCVASFPKLQKIHDTYKDKGLLVITCCPANTTSRQEAQKILEQQGYTFAAGASNSLWLDYAIQGNPTYFLIDRQGRLAWGPEYSLPSEEILMKLLE